MVKSVPKKIYIKVFVRDIGGLLFFHLTVLNQLSERQQVEFKEKHMAEITQLVGNEGVWFNTEVLIAIAQK